MKQEKNEFQHTIPKMVLKNFLDGQGIWICDKEKGLISKRRTPIKKPGYSVSFGKNNFYGHTKIEKITDQETISKKEDIRIEDLFSEIESDIAKVFEKIIKEKSIKLSKEECSLIKKYCFIQHIRTPKFKKDLEDFLRTKFVKNLLFPLSKKNRKKVKNKYCSKNHSILVESKSFKDFIAETKLDEKLIHLLSIPNNSKDSFLLPDSGLIWARIKEIEEDVCYIPITPKICIFLSKQRKGKLHLHNPKTLQELSWMEADKEIYSNNKNELEKIYFEMKNKKIICHKDGTKTFG